MFLRWFWRLLLADPKREQSGGEEHRLRIEKLRYEVTVARYQASPEALRNERRKAWTAITSLIVATVGVGSLLVTAGQWLKSDADVRAGRRQERLERNIAALSNSDRFARLAAVAALRRFLQSDNTEQREIAISALASALSVETSPLVRDSLGSALTSSDLPMSTRTEVLQGVVQVSRGLLAEYREVEEKPGADAQRLGIRARAEAVAGIITEMLRSGVRVGNLADTYLQGVNFSRMDLSGVLFDNAFLAGADFSGANLDRASFRDATLIMTRFRGARLRGATLAQGEQGARTNFAPGRADRPHRTAVLIGADFTCADLQNANLHGQPAFIIIADDAIPVVVSLEFTGANLKNADFAEARMLAVARPPRSILQLPLFPTNPLESAHDREGILVYSLIDARWPYRSIPGFDRSRAVNNFVFSSTNWKEAHLPPPVQDALVWAEVPSVAKANCDDLLRSDLHGSALIF